MKAPVTLEPVAFAILFATLGYVWFGLAPSSPFLNISDPANSALIAAVMVAIGLLVLRLLPNRPPKLEHFIVTVFLAAMPVIYLWAALRTPNTSLQTMLLEGFGLIIFGGIALLGYLRSRLLLTAGILAHGLIWDAWHHHFAYIQNWYTTGCLVIDLALAFLLAVQFFAQASQPSLEAAHE